MNLTEENKVFYFAVYSVVSQIPEGMVTSYGHIAELIGRPQNSRLVGFSLKHFSYIVNSLKEDDPALSHQFNNLPWWRVLSSVGKISPRGNSNFEITQAKLLRSEGVIVSSAHKVDLEEYGWFPDSVDL